VTEPAKAADVLVPAEEGDAAALAAVAEVEAGELEAVLAGELELELELQAAAPASRQAPTAAMRHLEPPGILRDIPVKRTIAPCRLSAVNSPVSGPSSARCGSCRGAYRIDRPINLSSR
jgi:hypothetical protein